MCVRWGLHYVLFGGTLADVFQELVDKEKHLRELEAQQAEAQKDVDRFKHREKLTQDVEVLRRKKIMVEAETARRKAVRLLSIFFFSFSL